jgi:DNA end-binding protein Ku
MRSIWNGSISFGLVNIPISLYSAAEQPAGRFRLIHKKHHKPIRYMRSCEGCEADVPWDEIEKAIEVSKNRYIVISREELESIRPERSRAIEILAFMESRALDPIFLDKHYYVGPDKGMEKTYFLFKEVLQQSAKLAIGRFVLRERESLCALESYRQGILMTTLHFAEDIRDISGIAELGEPARLKQDELELAKQLIDRLARQEFDLSQYKDTFSDDLKELVKRKVDGETITIEKPRQRVTDEENLIEALRASLQ